MFFLKLHDLEMYPRVDETYVFFVLKRKVLNFLDVSMQMQLAELFSPPEWGGGFSTCR